MTYLLEIGASPATEDGGGFTPLHVAAVEGKTEIVQLLSLAGTDKYEFGNMEKTPLYPAVYNGHSAVEYKFF